MIHMKGVAYDQTYRMEAITWSHDVKIFFNRGNVTFFRFWQKRRQNISIWARNFSYFVVFYGGLWLRSPLENFLGMIRQWYGYLKHCPVSVLSSALWIIVVRYPKHFIFAKVLTPPLTPQFGRRFFIFCPIQRIYACFDLLCANFG